MKPVLTLMLISMMSFAYSQTPQPVEERYPVSYWWWVIGVLLAIGAGIVLYMLLKKDPRRDAID